MFWPSELLRIVISCKIVNSSMKFKFIHKIFLIQEKFLVYFKLLRGPDITRSGAGFGPRVVYPCSILSNPEILNIHVICQRSTGTISWFHVCAWAHLWRLFQL